MTQYKDDRGAYRCAISPENSTAKLKVGKKQYDVNVTDTSRMGFTICMPDKLATKIDRKKPCILEYSGERWELLADSQYNKGDGRSDVGFIRHQDLTKMKAPASWGLSFMPTFSTACDPTFLFFLMIAFLVACISLPGIGDGIGTAPKVNTGVRGLISAISNAGK